MKPTNFFSKIQFFALTLMANLAVVWVNAQEKAADLKVDVDLDKGGAAEAGWMSNPLVWVIGALVLILLVALVARGGGRKS